MARDFPEEVDAYEVVKRYIKSVDKGLLKVMSKMGISTYQSYCGAQIFDAIGLSRGFVQKFFAGTATTIEGVGLPEVAEETVSRHRDAFGDAPVYRTALEVGGEYAYRIRGEAHSWSPQTVSLLQHAVRGNSEDKYRAFAKLLNDQSERLLTIRGLFRIRTAEEDGTQARAARRSRACGRDRQALRHWRDVLRLDLARGPHDARHRDEPDRRQVEHRRRR